MNKMWVIKNTNQMTMIVVIIMKSKILLIKTLRKLVKKVKKLKKNKAIRSLYYQKKNKWLKPHLLFKQLELLDHVNQLPQ